MTRSFLSKIGRVIKLVVIGSVVVTRSTGDAEAPENGLQHELAWMAVREGLTRTSSETELSADIRRLVMETGAEDLEYRVRSTYLNVSADEIARLDSLWMDSLMQSGANADATDRFLAERSRAMSSLLLTQHSDVETVAQLRTVERIYKRTPYDA
ncbi:MAG: hypothetical protein AAGA70_16875 [Pseudomonadota bacterium]